MSLKKEKKIDGCPKDTICAEYRKTSIKKHAKRVDSMIKFYDKMVGLSVDDKESVGVINKILKDYIDQIL